MVLKDYKIYTAHENEIIIRDELSLAKKVWPEFMLHDPIASKYFGRLYDEMPEYQFGLIGDKNNRLIAVGNCIPLYWNEPFENLPEKGWDWALEHGFSDYKKDIKPNIICALQIMIDPDFTGLGLSAKLIEVMREIGREHKLNHLIAPVRPNKKHEYPHISIDEFITWENEDGLFFDPWLRVHQKIGGKIIKPCHQAMEIPGTVLDWQNWTGLKFSKTGEYIVHGALNPVKIDIEKDLGLYLEPNVWMVHGI